MTLHLENARAREWALLPESEAADALMRRQPGVGVADRLRHGCSVPGGGRDHGCVHGGAARVVLEADDDALLDGVLACELELHILWKDLHPVRKHDHVLQTSPQLEKALAVDLSDVPGSEPAVARERGAGRVLVVPVALRDVRSPDEYLAVAREAHLNSGERSPDRTGPPRVRGVRGDRRRALGRAVALEHRDAHPLPSRGDGGGEGGPAAEEQREPPAELSVYVTEEKTSSPGRQPRGQTVRGLPAFPPPPFLHLALDAVEEKGQHLRHDYHRGHAVALQRPQDHG